jgi:GTP-binding protein
MEEQERILLRELGDYQADLLDRPRVVVMARSDLATDSVTGEYVISSITGEGLDKLVGALASLVTDARAHEAANVSHEIVVHRPMPEALIVERTGDRRWEIVGRAAQRAVRFQDLTNDEALEEIVNRLRGLGVDRLLTRAGVRDGDEVTIGELNFEWWKDQSGAGLDRGEHHRATRRERLARSGRLHSDSEDDDDGFDD